MSIADKFRTFFSANGNSAVALDEPISGAAGIESIAIDPKPVPEAPKAAANQLRGPEIDGREEGVPGTPNLAGFIRDLGEYNPQLDALNGIRTYEKMRRQDPTVAALEAAVRLPIRAAEWSIEPGADKNEPGRALAKEIAAMVEENLFGGLERETSAGKQTQSFESVIENALLCAPLGVAGSEDLWKTDTGKNAVRLSRIAPRLPATFYQFLVDDDGETLKTLVQFGYRGAEVNLFPVPAGKMTLFIFNREGANFYGRSMLRPAYQPWYFKSKLMVIDAIGAEKNRIAVPVIMQGPNATPDDVNKSWEWAQNLAANERMGLSMPSGWEFKQVGIEGRAMPLIEAIRYYDEQIADAGLGGFLSLGKTASGSRALGDVKTDFFLLAENALARMIAEAITLTSIRRLVDFNYQAKQGEGLPYPRLACSNILMVNALDVANAVKELADSRVNWLETTEERDNALAQKLGLPPISGTPRPKYAPIVRQIREMDQGDEAIPDEDAPKAPSNAPKKGGAKRDAVEVKQPGGGGEQEEFSEVKTARPQWQPKNDFEKFVDQAALRNQEDKTQRVVARLMRRAKPALVEQAARQAAYTPLTSLGHVAAPFDSALVAQIERALDRAFAMGDKSVERELKAQKSQSQTLTEKKKGLPAGGKKGGAVKKRLLNAKLIAQATVTDLNNWINSRATGAAVDLSKDGLSGDDLEDGVSDALNGASDGFIDRGAAEAARQAVAGGRMRAFDRHSDDLQRIVRREVMDGNTCEPCQEGDGREWNSWDDVDWHPGDDCEGGDACRGDLIAEFATGISSDD